MNPETPNPGGELAKIVTIFVAVLGSVLVGGTMAGGLVALVYDVPLPSVVDEKPLPLLLLSVVFNAIPLLLFSLVPLGPKTRTRLGRGAPIMVFVWATAGLLALAGAMSVSVEALGLEKFGSLAFFEETLGQLDLPTRLGAGLVLGLLPGFFEELFFRGKMMPHLERSSTRRTAWLISSFAFGFIHLDPLHAPLAAVMGLYMGAVVLSTNSLWPAVVAHVVNNFYSTVTVDWPEAPLWTLPLLVSLSALALLRIRLSGGPFFGEADLSSTSTEPSMPE